MNATASVRVVMLGCGGFARRYHVPAFEADAGVTFAAIFDPAPGEATRALARRHGAVLVDAVAALPDAAGPTLALVTTPHALHAAHAAAALARGWHTLVDKPFVLHEAEARTLAADAARRGLVNAVAYNRRFDRGCLRAREIVRSGALGAVRLVQTVQLGYERGGWFLDPALGGGGPFTGRASHMADVVPWLIGRKATALRARIRGGSPTLADRGGFIELRLGDLECQMTCIEEGWHSWDEVRIFGEDGLVELRRPLALPLGWELRWWSRRGDAREFLAADPDMGAATRDFLAAIRTGSPVACSFADAVPAVGIVEQAFAAAREPEAWRDLA